MGWGKFIGTAGLFGAYENTKLLKKKTGVYPKIQHS